MTCRAPPDAEMLVGNAGTVNGVTAVDADELAEFPATFAATTVNVYAVPFANPVTVQVVAGVAPVVEHVSEPGDEVTV